jgi:hypothetical protein
MELISRAWLLARCLESVGD